MKDPNDVCKCIIALLSLNVRIKKMDIVPVVVSKLANKYVKTFEMDKVKDS